MSVGFVKTPPALLENFKELERVGRYPRRMSMLLPALHLAQEHYGWISPEAIADVSAFLGLAENNVKGIASFYSMLFMEKPGKYVLQVCHNVSCYLEGAEDIVKHIEEKLGIKCGETTPDGKFSLVTVECLAACGRGTVIQVSNQKYYEHMTIEKVDELLDGFE